MTKTKHLWLLALLVLMACGPDTIFLRPELDTPTQHVTNGFALLKQEKMEDACREFERAKELDPDYTDAYVGHALALGGLGRTDQAKTMMDQAFDVARSPDDLQKVQEGYRQLKEFNRLNPEAPLQY